MNYTGVKENFEVEGFCLVFFLCVFVFGPWNCRELHTDG